MPRNRYEIGTMVEFPIALNNSVTGEAEDAGGLGAIVLFPDGEETASYVYGVESSPPSESTIVKTATGRYLFRWHTTELEEGVYRVQIAATSPYYAHTRKIELVRARVV